MELQKRTRFSDNNREEILTYYEAGGEASGIILTPKQKELTERWLFADEKIRENKYLREQVANFIIAKFRVGRDTAYKDIVNAEYVFSSSFPLNKRYEIGLRIQFVKKKINDAYLDKEYEVAAKLEQVLQKYIKDYPDYLPPRAPKQIILNVQNNNLIVTSFTHEQAYEQADSIAKELLGDDDITNYLEDPERDDY